MKEGKVLDYQKEIIYDIVQQLTDNEIQKRKFCMYYSLGTNKNEKNTYKRIADFYGVSPNAIRGSINLIRNKLLRTTDENIVILQDVVNDCERRNK